MALGYFGMPHSSPISIHCCDGLDFLESGKHTTNYDLVLIDAFDESSMSKTIYTADFFHLSLECLRPGGVLSCNLWSGDQEELQSVEEAFNRYSRSRIYIPVRQRGNIVGMAFTSPIPWRKIDRPKTELALLSQRYHFDLAEIVKTAKRHNLSFRHQVGSLFTRHGHGDSQN
jgi:spermidine synthase